MMTYDDDNAAAAADFDDDDVGDDDDFDMIVKTGNYFVAPPRLTWKSLWRPNWPHTQRDLPCPCLQNAGIKLVYSNTWLAVQ